MKITKTQLRQIIREEIQSIREASLNPVVDKLIKSGNKKRIKIELDHFKRVAQDKLFDKVVNPKAVKYSIDALERALKESINEGKLNEAKFKDIDVKKLGKKKTNDLMKYLFNIVDLGLKTDMKTDTKKKILSVNISKISPKVAQNIQKRFGVDLTEGKLVIREEIQSIKEGGMGILDSDQADILQAIVMRNKNKNSKAILSIAMKDRIFKGVDKKELLGYIEGAKQFVKYMKSHPMR